MAAGRHLSMGLHPSGHHCPRTGRPSDHEMGAHQGEDRLAQEAEAPVLEVVAVAALAAAAERSLHPVYRWYHLTWGPHRRRTAAQEAGAALAGPTWLRLPRLATTCAIVLPIAHAWRRSGGSNNIQDRERITRR